MILLFGAKIVCTVDILSTTWIGSVNTPCVLFRVVVVNVLYFEFKNNTFYIEFNEIYLYNNKIYNIIINLYVLLQKIIQKL